MRQNAVEEKIAKIVEPVIADAGFALVAVQIKGGARGGQEVTIMAENPQTRRLGVDECAQISKAVSAVLDVEDPIKGAYRLEISSPGIDRPLIKPQDFTDFAGFETKIELDAPIEGQKRFKGRLTGLDNGEIGLETEQGAIKLPFASIHRAKLVLSDELIEARGKTG